MNPFASFGLPDRFRSRASRRGHVLDALSILSPVLIKNESSETMPPLSMVEVSSNTTTNLLDNAAIGNDLVLRCVKVTSEDTELYVSTGLVSIPAGKTGPGYVGTILPFKMSAAIGDFLTPRVNSFTPSVSTSGPLVVYASQGGVVLAKHVASGIQQNEIVFRLVDSSSGSASQSGASGSEECFTGSVDPIIGEVLYQACPAVAIDGIDENGQVELTDPLGWLDNRSIDEVAGKVGVASLHVAYSASGSASNTDCQWIIDVINLQEQAEVLAPPVSLTSEGLTFKCLKIIVWGQCDAGTKTIPVTECPDGSSV